MEIEQNADTEFLRVHASGGIDDTLDQTDPSLSLRTRTITRLQRRVRRTIVLYILQRMVNE